MKHGHCDHDHEHGHGDCGHKHGHHQGHGRGHRHGGPRDESRMRLRRLFRHGDLRFVIMQLIAEKPRHGYETIKAIEEKVSGAYSPSPGVIYPTLTMLEEMGYVTLTAGDGSKKLYTITSEGRKFVDENRKEIDDIHTKISELAATQSQKPAQVVRAMENLRFALRLRLSRGALNDDQASKIAAALDGAVSAIEKA